MANNSNSQYSIWLFHFIHRIILIDKINKCYFTEIHWLDITPQYVSASAVNSSSHNYFLRNCFKGYWSSFTTRGVFSSEYACDDFTSEFELFWWSLGDNWVGFGTPLFSVNVEFSGLCCSQQTIRLVMLGVMVEVE